MFLRSKTRVSGVTAQALRQVVPGGLGLLDRRLGEAPQRPAVDYSRTGIPRPYHKALGGIVRCPRRRLGAVAPVFIKYLVVDREPSCRADRGCASLTHHRTSPSREKGAPRAAARRAPGRTSAAPPEYWTGGSPASWPSCRDGRDAIGSRKSGPTAIGQGSPRLAGPATWRFVARSRSSAAGSAPATRPPAQRRR
jgi:hypothetical protein